MARPHAPRRPGPAQAVGHEGRSPCSLGGRPPFSPPAPRPYPYKIPPPPKPDPRTLKQLDRREVIEFVRIEALLRSPVVWALYRQALRRTQRRRYSAPPVRNVELWTFLYMGNMENRLKLRGKADAEIRGLLWNSSLRKRFTVEDGWAVLLGSHHRYLRPRLSPFHISHAIVDLARLHRTPGLYFDLKYLEEHSSRYLYLMINYAAISRADLAALDHELRERQKAESPDTGRRKAPPIKDVRAWLNYFRCYDLRRCEGASFGEIGQRVYDAPEGRSGQAVKKRQTATREAKRAFKKVNDLIPCAEKGPWRLPRL